jgi:hypothetical protein
MDQQLIERRFEGAYLAAGLPSGNTWYHQANSMVKTLADAKGVDFNICAGIVAILSPRVKWVTTKGHFTNLDAAKNLIDGCQAGDSTEVICSKVAGFNSNVRKAIRLLETGDLSLVTGNKVASFYANIVDPDNDDNVTIDSWMIAVGFDFDLTSGKDNQKTLTDNQYQVVKTALQVIAERYAIGAVSLQAIIWEWAKSTAQKQAGEKAFRF